MNPPAMTHQNPVRRQDPDNLMSLNIVTPGFRLGAGHLSDLSRDDLRKGLNNGGALLLRDFDTSVAEFSALVERVSDRVSAIHVAQEGADFVETFHHLRDRGLPDADAYTTTQRVFRGGMVTGRSVFTKDLSYVKGFVENVNFIRSAIGAGLPELIPMLFAGKITLEDIPVLYEAYLEGIVEPPRYLPDMFRDLNGLYVWFGFSNGLSLVDMKRVQKHYLKTFDQITPVCPLEMAPGQTPEGDLDPLP